MRERERTDGWLEGVSRALPTETKVKIGTSQSKRGSSVNLSYSGDLRGDLGKLDEDAEAVRGRDEVREVVGEGDVRRERIDGWVEENRWLAGKNRWLAGE